MRSILSAVVKLAAVASLLVPAAVAQNQGGGNQGGANQGGGNQGNQPPGGILISPEGVVAGATIVPQPGRLQQKRLRALASRYLSAEINTVSAMRMVSLVRLEEECRRRLDAEQPLPTEILYLAGLTRVEYVFLDPESSDLVIAGPAEGFGTTDNGRVVGTESGRPVLTLTDLLVMLRLKNAHNTIGCSFDPDPDRLARAQAWLQSNSDPVTVEVAKARFLEVANILGMWNVSIFGVPPSSQTAASFVEADYQLKRLTLGLDSPRVRGFRSYLAMATIYGNMMRRWWFTARYESLEASPDETAFHMTGPRLQLMSQDELVDAAGNRKDAPDSTASNEKFTRQFNEKMEELCERVPSMAVLQNQFDLAVAAALIRTYRLAERIDWTADLFLDDQRLTLHQYSVAEQVPSQVNVRFTAGQLMIGLVGGGITMVPASVVNRDRLTIRDDLKMPAMNAEPNSWWWDVDVQKADLQK
ncbi:MAG: DUF1598 domain-containing protein [Planctomycetaceae bacterium]